MHQLQGFFERNTQFDGVLVLAWAFFVFFGILVYWLRREDKREGYPMVDGLPGRPAVEGFPLPPPPKSYRRLWRDEITQMPHHYGSPPVRARRLLRFAGAPLVPVGNPLLANVGPGAYPLRDDRPMLAHGTPQVVPLRRATDWSVAKGDADPRGMAVLDGRRTPVGVVHDLWVDRGVKIIRYLEVRLELPGAADRHVLVPIFYTAIGSRSRRVVVRSLLAEQFADIPGLSQPDQITAREEDSVSAYHAGGLLFSRGNDGGLPVPGRALEAG